MIHRFYLLPLFFFRTTILRQSSSLLLHGSFLFGTLTFATAEDCGTCINGICNEGVCRCNDGYDGSDCTMPYVTCRDGYRKCYNGSECRRNRQRDPDTRQFKYSCDCSKAYGISSFVGIQCEYSATEECEKGVANSDYTFCTNGGKCLEKVDSGVAHQGCYCVGSFEGLHCEYRKGEAPAEELALVELLKKSRERNTSGISGFITTFIILVSFIIVGMFTFILYKKKVESGREKWGEEFSSVELNIVKENFSEVELKKEKEEIAEPKSEII